MTVYLIFLEATSSQQTNARLNYYLDTKPFGYVPGSTECSNTTPGLIYWTVS